MLKKDEKKWIQYIKNKKCRTCMFLRYPDKKRNWCMLKDIKVHPIDKACGEYDEFLGFGTTCE
jgi:ribosomal protein L25 (general stress protein Ctc)